MAKKRKSAALQLQDDSFSLTSMIDVVFLLLIYFMYLPIQQEADLSVQLPVPVPPDPNEKIVLPSEQKVKIMPDGSIALNDSMIASFEEIKAGKPLTVLANNLKRLNASATNAGIKMIVTIIPDGDAPHQASMSVLDACAKAGVKQVSFSDAI